MEKGLIMNLPNRLTLLRLALVPLVIILIIINQPVCKWLALLAFGAASLTDMIDGRLARRSNQVTTLGKFLDPLADKALVCSVLICFIARARLVSRRHSGGDSRILGFGHQARRSR
jgi:CDP-diacylglycerol--glycerol-3-phosphate 3-phosphatidyltransferase